MPETNHGKQDLLEERARKRFCLLSEAERNLLRAVQEGKSAECGPAAGKRPAPEVDPSRANEWDTQRTIRTALLRWLCIDRAAMECIDPYGIRISFAKLIGRLDLSFITLPFPLYCTSCWCPEGFQLAGATLRGISLESTWVGPLGAGTEFSRTEPIIAANLAVITGSVLFGRGFRAEGRVRLFGSEIRGNLECDGGHFNAPGNVALDLERARIGGGVYLRNGFAAEGEVRLFLAEIGSLECGGGSFKNAGNVALNAEGAKIGGPVYLRNGFAAEGEVRLLGAQTAAVLSAMVAPSKIQMAMRLMQRLRRSVAQFFFAIPSMRKAKCVCTAPRRVVI